MPLKKQHWLRVGITVLLVALIILAICYRKYIDLESLQQALQTLGIWAPIAFISLYALVTIAFLPGSIITLLGGLLFGAYLGTLYNLIGATIGATIAFIIARFIAGDWVRRKTDGNRLHTLMDGVRESGWRFVAVVRFMPIIPFNLLNYALGLTGIRLPSYIIASAIFMLPGTFVYTYIGSLGIAFIQGDAKTIVSKVSIGIGLLVLLAVLPWIIKKLRFQK